MFSKINTPRNESIVEYNADTGEGRENVEANITTPNWENKEESNYCYFYFHNDSRIFPSPDEDGVEVGGVLSLGCSEDTGKNYTQELDAKYPFRQDVKLLNEKDNSGSLYYQRCGYLDSKTNTWKSDGCKTVSVDESSTRCKCTRHPQMAGFGVLVKTYSVEDSLPMHIISTIGCAVSTLCLLVMVGVYLAFRSLRANEINQIHINLSICLMISYMTFMLGLARTRDYVSCMSAAAVLHFSLLSAWGWMLVESITMFRKFVMIFSRSSKKYLLKCAVVVYFISACIVLTNTIVASKIDEKTWQNWTMAYAGDLDFRPSVYIGDAFCWLHGYSLYFGFLTPVGIILILNLMSVIFITRKITSTTSKVKGSKSSAEVKEQIIRTLMLVIIFGLPWAAGIPLTITSLKEIHEIFGYLFTFLVAYQGVFIFILFCLKRKDVRKLCKESISTAIESRIQSSVSNATATSKVSSAVNHKIYQETALTVTATEFRSRLDAGEITKNE